MTLVNAYCTVQEVRDELTDSGASATNTALIEKAINGSSRAIDNWCSGGQVGETGRRFWRDASVTTRLFRCDDPLRAWVLDFSGSAGLIVKTDPGADGTFSTTWTSADYQLEPLNGGVVAGGDTATPFAFWEIVAVKTLTFPVFSQRAGLQVTARFGWSTIPDEVNQACVLKAASVYKRKDPAFAASGGLGEFGVFITRKDPEVIDLLRAYPKTRTRILSYQPQAGSLFHWR